MSYPSHQEPLVKAIATLVVDYLVATGVLKDAEALRREGEARERARQRKKAKAKATKSTKAAKKKRKAKKK